MVDLVGRGDSDFRANALPSSGYAAILPAVTVQDEIFAWVAGFEPWKQDLFLHAAATQDLTDAQVARAVGLLLNELEDSSTRRATRSDMPGGDREGSKLALTSVTGVTGVNALAAGQNLSFEKNGLNLVYGANGAGKTGYCRIVKWAGRTLAPEEVQPNAEAPSRPSATIVASIDDQLVEFATDFEGLAPPELAAMSVFDSKAAERYLVRDHAVDYIPLALRGVERLAVALRRLEKNLDQRIANIDAAPLNLSAFAEGTEVHALLKDLDGSTSDERLMKLAVLSVDDEQRREKLRQELGEIVSRKAGQLRQEAERRTDLVIAMWDALCTVAAALGSASAQAAKDELTTLASAEAAARHASDQFRGEPVPGVGSGPWRVMWNAAREFAAQAPGHSLPPSGDHDVALCPLCMQQLGDDARRRLQDFDEFVRANINAHLAVAQRAVEKRKESLPDIADFFERHSEAVALVDSDESGHDDLDGNIVRQWLAAASTVVAAIRSGELTDAVVGVAEPPLGDLGQIIERFSCEAKRHAALEETDVQHRIRADLHELDDRATLARQLPEARAKVVAHREVARLRKAKGKLTTTGVSSKLTQFAKSFIKADLEGALNRHLRELSFDGLEVEITTRTEGGRPMVGLTFKSVGGAALCDVLSAGEQRRLALAMFLAECEISRDLGPVVLDDPVCSIDQEGRRHIARCLVELASRRQVIVFTHELAFLSKLNDLATGRHPAIDLHAQHVVRIHREAGHVRASLPWIGLKASDRVDPLRIKLEKAIAARATDDVEMYRGPIEEFCNYLRQAFERCVEERVLAGVVTRGSEAVQTQKLSQVLLTEQISGLVDQGMGENSPWVHDRSMYDNAMLPTGDEMQVGLDCYVALLGALAVSDRERQKLREKRKAEQVRKIKAADCGNVSLRDELARVVGEDDLADRPDLARSGL